MTNWKKLQLNNSPVNITILDSSKIIFEGLANIINKSGHYFKLFKADNFNEIENIIHSDKPDVLIINPMLIQNKEKEFLLFKKNLPESLFIALIYSYVSPQIITLFDKEIQITDSPETIINLISNTKTTSATNDQEQLSEREIDVLKLIIAGMSNKQIADKLFISIHTVISHRKNISAKTGIKSQSGLTIYALSNKIVQMEDFTM